MEPRILTLQIDKVLPGQYRTEVREGSSQVTDESMHSSIADAIREEALAVPEGFAHFMEVRYHGMSSGTYALRDLTQQADAVADRLVSLLAEMHEIAEGGT